jgi:hypothetical protein
MIPKSLDFLVIVAAKQHFTQKADPQVEGSNKVLVMCDASNATGHLVIIFCWPTLAIGHLGLSK